MLFPYGLLALRVASHARIASSVISCAGRSSSVESSLSTLFSALVQSNAGYGRAMATYAAGGWRVEQGGAGAGKALPFPHLSKATD